MKIQEASSTVTLSIVITSWNSLFQLRECLGSVLNLAMGLPPFEVIVVDSHSMDGTHRYLRDLEETTRHVLRLTIRSCSDRGWTFACNQGIRLSKGEWIALSNPDIVFTKDLIRLVTEATTDYPVQSVQLLTDHGECLATRKVTLPFMFFMFMDLGFWIDRKLGLPFRRRYEIRTDRPVVVEHPPASFMMIHRSVFEKLGLFNERYFLYLADSEFLARVNDAKLLCLHRGDLVFHHVGGYSEAKRTRQEFSHLQEEGMLRYAGRRGFILRVFLGLNRLFNRSRHRWIIKPRSGSSSLRRVSNHWSCLSGRNIDE